MSIAYRSDQDYPLTWDQLDNNFRETATIASNASTTASNAAADASRAIAVVGTLTGENGSANVGFIQAGTDAVARTAQDKMREVVSVKDFKCADGLAVQGDGIHDDTTGIQAAIDYCKSAKVSVGGVAAFNGGHPSLYFPTGIYNVSATLNIEGFIGFKLYGAGQQSTHIVFTALNSTLFKWSTYLYCQIRDMTIDSGSVTMVGGTPSYTGDTTKSNVCIQFNSTASGAFFSESNVTYRYWRTVYDTKTSIVNGDNHTHTDCMYQWNGAVWDNTNTQAVRWTFNSCNALFNDNCYINPGISLLVIGGDYINPGVFLTVGLTNTSLNVVIDCVNFENYQNLDPTSSPKFIVCTGGGADVTFRKCIAVGGGTLAGKTSGVLSGLYSVVLEECQFSGTWDTTNSSSVGGLLPRLTFNNCKGTPSVNQILVGGQGNKPLNLSYINHREGGGYSNIDRNFIGALASQLVGVKSTTFTDVFRYEGVLNATTGSRACPIFVPSPYVVQLVGVEIDWTNNTTNTVVIDIWESSSKTVKLATVTTAAASGAFQPLEVPLSGILARYPISAASQPLHVEFVAATNAGSCKAFVGLKFRQVSQ